MPYNVSTRAGSGNRRGVRGRSPWARATPAQHRMAQCLPADPWMVEEKATRDRLFADAKGENRRKALAALGALRERYRLRLPLVEARWGLDDVHGSRVWRRAQRRATHMTVGTKSVLFGAHQFLMHPCFVAAAWRQIYGFPWDLRLWVAFFVHDLGYLGKPNMDGPEGERHVDLGATIMGCLFGPVWRDLCLYHSRFRAKRDGAKPSRLCIADKLAIALTPAWLYLPMVRLTGEITEYRELARARKAGGEGKYATMNVSGNDDLEWYADVQAYLRRWVAEFKDGREDTWTPRTVREPAGPRELKADG